MASNSLFKGIGDLGRNVCRVKIDAQRRIGSQHVHLIVCDVEKMPIATGVGASSLAKPKATNMNVRDIRDRIECALLTARRTPKTQALAAAWSGINYLYVHYVPPNTLTILSFIASSVSKGPCKFACAASAYGRQLT